MNRGNRLDNSSVGNFTSILSDDLEKVFNKQTKCIVDAIKSLKEPTPKLPDYVETNLNFYIKVKLTEHGKEIHRDYWEPICDKANTTYKEPKVDSDGWSSFQLHEFMLIFGSKMYMAAPLVCETDILIQRSK